MWAENMHPIYLKPAHLYSIKYKVRKLALVVKQKDLFSVISNRELQSC